ncbi:MAG TPA: hypothetical protein VNJ09_06720, partial [Chthonomonadales bacterium]|nr:hypothetical protein [Chthonomonadales bacterium]
AELGFQSVLYSLPTGAFSTTPILTPDTPAPTVVFDHGPGGTAVIGRDSHGLVLTRHRRYLWAADRAANTILVVDPDTDSVVNEFSLNGLDPAPDILGLSPGGNRVYMTMRGPFPLTGNNPAVGNAVGATPGLGVIQVKHGGLTGVFLGGVRISHIDPGSGTERADPHGLAVRTIAGKK